MVINSDNHFFFLLIRWYFSHSFSIFEMWKFFHFYPVEIIIYKWLLQGPFRSPFRKKKIIWKFPHQIWTQVNFSIHIWQVTKINFRIWIFHATSFDWNLKIIWSTSVQLNYFEELAPDQCCSSFTLLHGKWAYRMRSASTFFLYYIFQSLTINGLIDIFKIRNKRSNV